MMQETNEMPEGLGLIFRTYSRLLELYLLTKNAILAILNLHMRTINCPYCNKPLEKVMADAFVAVPSAATGLPAWARTPMDISSLTATCLNS